MGKKHKVLCGLPFAGLFFGRPTWPERHPIFSALPSALPLFRRGVVLPQRVADEVAQLGGDLAADGLRDEPEPAVEERRNGHRPARGVDAHAAVLDAVLLGQRGDARAFAVLVVIDRLRLDEERRQQRGGRPPRRRRASAARLRTRAQASGRPAATADGRRRGGRCPLPTRRRA